MFYRIEHGGRPMGIVFAKDNRTAYIAIISRTRFKSWDIESKEVSSPCRRQRCTAHSGSSRYGNYYYDGRRSLDQWYSCHTCHYNGGINSRRWTPKRRQHQHIQTAPAAREVASDSALERWHGCRPIEPTPEAFVYQDDAADRTSTTKTACDSVLSGIRWRSRPSPYRLPDGSLTRRPTRRIVIFRSEKAGCATCHSGRCLPTGKYTKLAWEAKRIAYKGYILPIATGLYRKVRFLHDGRTKSLEQVLTDIMRPKMWQAKAS